MVEPQQLPLDDEPQKPSSGTVLFVPLAGIVVGGPLLAMFALIFLATLTLLLITTPLLIIFSPVLLGATSVLVLSLTCFAASAAAMGLVGVSAFVWLFRLFDSIIGCGSAQNVMDESMLALKEEVTGQYGKDLQQKEENLQDDREDNKALVLGLIGMDSATPNPLHRRPLSRKLWPPSENKQLMFVERMMKNLSNPNIFTTKCGSLSKEVVAETAKRIEEIAFIFANEHYEKELDYLDSDSVASSAVQLYVKQCSKLILEVLQMRKC